MGTHDGTCSSAVSETSLRIASCVASCCCAYPAAADGDDDDEGDEEEGEEGRGAEGDAAAVEGLEEGARGGTVVFPQIAARFPPRPV